MNIIPVESTHLEAKPGRQAVLNPSRGRLERDVQDAEAAVRAGNRELLQITARDLAERRRRDSLASQLGQWEAHVRTAIRLGQDTAARGGAERVAELERQIAAADANLRAFAGCIARIRAATADEAARLAALKRDLHQAELREAARKRECVIRMGLRRGRAGLLAAERGLRRIKSLQQQREALADAATLVSAAMPRGSETCSAADIDRILSRLQRHAHRELH